MDTKFIQYPALSKFKKCGEVYKTPMISEKQYMFLSCLYCKEISWQLDTFLQHMEKKHQDDNISKVYIEEDVDIENSTTNIKDNSDNKNKALDTSSQDKEIADEEIERDPLDEEGYEYSDLLPIAIKKEQPDIRDADESVKRESEIKVIFSKEDDIIDANINNHDESNDESINENSSDDDYEPDKETTDDENYNDNTEEFGNDDDNDDDVDDYDNDDDEDLDLLTMDENEKTNLKRFTKNREFIKTIIGSYQKQYPLWDTAYKAQKRGSTVKQQALKRILKNINGKFKINATVQQIERIIKRLRLRYLHQTKMRNSGETCKPLWFYDLLKFIEPHLKENKQQISGLCKKLNDEQFLTLIKLFKENECFWNENNIYHTSVINKQEYLQSLTNNFSAICEMKELNNDIMQNTIDEIIEMAREENANKMKHQAADQTTDEYQPIIKYYKELQFLLPHVGPFKCKYCPKTFTDIYVFKFHTSKHEGNKPFKCMLCERELMHKKEFICHLRRHTKECPFQCDSCDKSFPTKKEWHRHVIKHGSKPYVCELCADSFYTQHQLTNHMKNHNNIRDHVCPECGKGFTYRGLLRQHLQTHNKTKCECTICHNIYANPRSLRKHYVRIHQTGQEPSAAALAQYNCKICKITFPSLQDANQHRKEHKQSNPAKRKHVCDICGHYFPYPRNLADHKKIHSNIRDQVCDVCGKAFTNTNLLNQHKNVHTGAKFVCKACGKDYAHYRGLCRHITKVHGTNIKYLDAFLEKQNVEIAPPSTLH